MRHVVDPSRRRRLLELFRLAPILPVITIDRVEDAVPLAHALYAGGLRVLEITLRTAVAVQAIEAIIREVPGVVVGVGTVLSTKDLARASDIGAQFALSPGTSAELLDAASTTNLPFVPGIATASELMAVLEHGFDIVKFFPAVPMGGMSALRALSSPFPNVRFCPTGGISEATAAEWLALPSVIAVGGSWMVPIDAIRERNWSNIVTLARRAAGIIKPN